MALEVNLVGEVDRTKPHAELDGSDTDVRLSRYRELSVMPFSYTKHPYVDEGSYFTANNAQTGLATAAAPTTFSATNPFLLLYNNGSVTDDFASRIYLDYILLLSTAAGTGATNIQFAIVKDSVSRYSSGGTEITANIVPCGPTSTSSAMKMWAGNITASAASASARTIVGNRVIKTYTAPAPTVNDQYMVRSGAPSVSENLVYTNNGTTLITSMKTVDSIPPIVAGAGESILFYLWFTGQSAASSFAPEVSWWER